MIAPRLLGGAVFAAVLMTTGMVRADEIPLVLRNGNLVEGGLVSSTDDSVTLQVGSATIKYELSKIEPHSFYSVRCHDIGDDAAAHVKLARFCEDEGLYQYANLEFQRAVALDPSLTSGISADLLKVQEGLAGVILDAAKKQLTHDHAMQARRYLSDVLTRYPQTRAAAEAKTMMGQAQQQAEEQRGAIKKEAQQKHQVALTKIQDMKEKEAAHEHHEANQKLLEPAERALKEGDHLNQIGQQNLEDDWYKKAAAKYKQAVYHLEQLQKSHGKDAELMDQVGKMLAVAKKDAIHAYLSLGNLYLSRTSYDQARQMANEALAVDPKDPAALQFQTEASQASSGGGDWVRGARWRPVRRARRR